MGFLDTFKKKNEATTTAPAPAPTPTSAPSAAGGGLLTTKKITQGQSALLVRKQSSGDEFTLIATWGQKDYDLYALWSTSTVTSKSSPASAPCVTRSASR